MSVTYKEAIAYSHNYATAKPDIGKTEKEHILGLCSVLEKVGKDRDALAVHVERLRLVAESMDHFNDSADLADAEVALADSGDALDSVFARRDAAMKAEALEQLLRERRGVEEASEADSVRAHARNMARRYRRQAEDPAGGAAPGSGPRHLLMPESLTVEGGFKKALIGEFSERCDERCSECLDGRDYDDGDECENCDGSGYIPQRVAVRWSTIKDIYAAAVAHYRRQAKGGDA